MLNQLPNITFYDATEYIKLPTNRFPIKKPAIEVKPEIKPEPAKPTKPKPKTEEINTDQISEIINKIKSQISTSSKQKAILAEKSIDQMADEVADFIKKKT